jgi:hypothetical protein
MANKQTIQKVTKSSLLSNFHLDYEMDKTWNEAKHHIKARTQR